MTIIEVLEQVRELLRSKGRITYRMLQVQFALNGAALEALKEELIEAERVAVDENGKVLVWAGASPVASSQLSVVSSQPLTPNTQPPTPRLQTSDLGLRTADFPGFWTPPHLAERIRAAQAAMEARGATDGERKTITALFADIKGSMALIENLDPEEARAIVDPALQLMMDAVHRYEGYVVQSTGDGIFAFFGAPLAHEDHPQRALYAALRMQEEMKRYAERLRLEKGCHLEIRVGINTGDVVLRSIRKDDLRTDYTPISHSTSLASRLEGLAPGGSIVVSEHTQRLTAGYFEFKPLGAARVKGVSEPVTLYEALGVGPLRTRLQVATRRGLTRFVGRQPELDYLRRALEQAKEGHGQIVGVMGEPGVGKSRLFHEFKFVAQSGCLVLETFSVSHSKAYPYLPLIDLLKNYFQIAPPDDEQRKKEKITGRVLTLDRSLEDTLPYVFALLSVAEPTAPLAQMDPQIRKRRTFEAIKRLLVRASLTQPLVLIFEDLHWLDSETQAFLGLLSESLASARILLLVNYRPEYRHEWGNKTFYTQLRLDPLGQEDAQELLAALLGHDPSLQLLKRIILEKTEGNPFFMEEIVQALVEEGVLTGLRRVGTAHLFVDLARIHIPPTVQGILAARIDRLPPAEKELLQTLAVIGKEFPLSLLKRVVNNPAEELQQLLAHLQAAEFIYEQPAFPEIEYTFKHALTQEVAYGSLLIERRKVLHEQTGQATEVLFHSQLEDHYGDLAHHYSRSGNTEKAVEYLHRAGEQAARRSAHTEAINHVTTALELLTTLPDTPERSHRELALQIDLSAPLTATKGWAAPEVGAVYARARELCHQIGETTLLSRVLSGQTVFHLLRGELRTARELGEEVLSLSQHQQDPVTFLLAHLNLGATLYWRGEFALAQSYLEQATILFSKFQQPVVIFVADLRVASLSYIAGSLWFLGYPDQALKKLLEALTLAQELAHPFSLAYALQFAGWLHQFRREVQGAQERAEALIALCSEQGFPQWLAEGTIRRGWTLSEQGQIEEGLEQMQRGRATYEATGAGLSRPYYLASLAEVSDKAGQTGKGLTLLAEALAIVEQNGERMWEAEVYRLKGELSLQSEVRSPRSEVTNPQPLIPNPQTEAEACFHKAIEIAQRQQAKSLELRVVMSLSRLWQQQGKKKEAHTLLAEIYDWFTEGFDTKDLQEAKALLEELAA